MKTPLYYLFWMFPAVAVIASARGWKDLPVPASAGQGKVWQLQENASDDFNYDSEATSAAATIGGKWTNSKHNAWNLLTQSRPSVPEGSQMNGPSKVLQALNEDATQSKTL